MKHQIAFTAPHHEAAKVGLDILKAGGTASEAMVAAAAMVSVQYPHMNSIGGDSFWLICEKDKAPVAIDGCGFAAEKATISHYKKMGDELPESGGEAAVTVAGTISAWDKALQINSSHIPLSQLLDPAINAARDGIEVTNSLHDASVKTYDRLHQLESFSDVFLKAGEVLKAGDSVKNLRLADTFEQLAERGLDDFYRGELAQQIAADLDALGSPISLSDLQAYQASVGEPLSVNTGKGCLYNHDAPTQGLASLLILAIYDRLADKVTCEVDHVHLLVEATKQAFLVRDNEITDPAHLAKSLQLWLDDSVVDSLAEQVDMSVAMPWPKVAKPGDTVWMGATDQYGTMVSFIQSVYWEFGSGAVLPNTGIVWNNRAKSFSLDPAHLNSLEPRKKPFHTLNPAYAELNDGRRIVYGTMGGEGQPQTQACLFTRFVYQDKALAQSIAEPRWLLGRTWGDDTNQLRLENQLFKALGDELTQRGHDITSVPDNSELMGHAGAIVMDSNGKTTAASDPRSDGLGIHGEDNGN
ncbi:gamma-glutamyltransferase [Vibrio albus]|uniref:Gamma-glutamyltransferase n=1 Tax=Vibrio albus TaxID=2200953 RepID=A0A2U3B6H5_9VIBR|nr:gamma-glutamyltransferase family protein [Vibrio albus]PWI32372.1 gamma-glutamyltransferase [Vibrio albus]